MLQKYSRYRILQEFFDFPKKNFQMREVARRIKLAQSSVIAHLKALVQEGFVLREEKGLYPSFRANRESDAFKLLKKQNVMWRISTSGLLSDLDTKLAPNCIILFGSAARGEDTEESDIDLFIQAEETKVDVTKYEKKLNRKINLFFEPNLKNLNKELLNNLINGEVLKGYLRVL